MCLQISVKNAKRMPKGCNPAAVTPYTLHPKFISLNLHSFVDKGVNTLYRAKHGSQPKTAPAKPYQLTGLLDRLGPTK